MATKRRDPASKVRGGDERSYRVSEVKGGDERSYPRPRSGAAARRRYPTPLHWRPRVAAGRSNPTSKEPWPRGCRRA